MSSESLRSLWVRFSSPALFDLSDEELMMNVRRDDDQKSYCVLYDRYKQRLFQWFVWNSSSKSLSEEFVQDVFFKVYAERKGFQPQSFRAWLYTIARNRLRDHFRRPYHLDEEVAGSWSQDELTSEEERLILRQQKKDLHEAMEELPARQREALTLWLAEEWSYEQMGELLQCSNQAAKNLVHRARRELVELFKGEEK